MSEQHTKEPRHVCEPTETLHAVRAETGRIVADVGYSDTDAQNRMNARRIVACVNACADMSTEYLEQCGKMRRNEAGESIVELIQQRDELLTKHQVACDTIERQRADIDAIRGYLDAMKNSCERKAQQRDELLAALRRVVADPYFTELDAESQYAAEQSIAKVKP